MQVLERTTQVTFTPLLRRYNLEEFWRLPDPKDRSHYELIGGTLHMVPPPDPPHGNIDARLAASLHAHLRQHNIAGQVHHPREAIYVDATAATYIEPDMMFVSDELADRMGERRTSADIVFEYSSRSTATYDQTTKADTYLALGARELWLIDSENVFIEVRNARMEQNEPVWRIRRYSRGESAESEVLKGWGVSVDGLFEGLVP